MSGSQVLGAVERPERSDGATVPASDGTSPCVVFFAGSGPTDRNWTSPLLPGANGSGVQLALELQSRGVGSIRFDEVGSASSDAGDAADGGLRCRTAPDRYA